jgi:hypothetical protein
MRKFTILFCLMLLALSLSRKMHAQDTANVQSSKTPDAVKPAAPVHYYRLDFVIEELGSDGKAVNSRNYSTSVSTEDRSAMSLRTGARIPVYTGPPVKDGQVDQYNYENVGINIDVSHPRELENRLAINLTADITGAAQPNDSGPRSPIIHQNRWQANVLIPIGKASTVFTSDSIDSKGSMRVVVTATPIQ